MPSTEGWMPQVERVVTNAYGRYPGLADGDLKPLAIMMHVMQGYQSTMVRWAEEQPFRTAKSAHITIGRKGRIVQHVSGFDASWAAGRANRPTWAGLPGDVGHIRSVNRYVINVELEGFSIDPVTYGYDYLYGQRRPWPEPMVAACIDVAAYFCDLHQLAPTDLTIIGHSATDSVSRSQDPGGAFPMDLVIAGAHRKVFFAGVTTPERDALEYKRLDAIEANAIEQAVKLQAVHDTVDLHRRRWAQVARGALLDRSG
jgi:N-acetyl-anhydromuramyl-L-alanine amidase AmpD